MSAEKATALVLRTTDWSETSRIATLWTRESGEASRLAKGGRRLKSNFETALDLLTVCSIVFLRKSSGSLDLLTEARVARRFPQLTGDLPALYAGYYIAELLADWTEDYDPHPRLFDEALQALADLGTPGVATGPRLLRFELVLLQELGYSPVLAGCAGCGREVAEAVTFSPKAGGLICAECQPRYRERRTVTPPAWRALREFSDDPDAWRREWSPKLRKELRQLLNYYVSYLLGRAAAPLALSGELNVVHKRRIRVRAVVGNVAPLLFGLVAVGGCTGLPKPDSEKVAKDSGSEESLWDRINPIKGPKAPPPPEDSLVIRAGYAEAVPPPPEGTAGADLLGARDLYRQGAFDKAEAVFHKIAENQKNSVQAVEEARYYEAECLRQQGHLPKAADTYHKMLIDFPSGAYRDQAINRMFDIANEWLDDTRAEMKEEQEKQEGKRWMIWPHFINFARRKPLFDEEGRAIEKLEQVRYNDMQGPLADKALFLMGSVKFFNKDYRDADAYFSQLTEMHPKSEFYSQAVELAIISKELCNGGPDYDGRKVAEARILVDAALRNCPDLASKKGEFLQRQIVGITLQQAEKEFKTAEFFQRTGHPGSAYYCYGLVCSRYPGTRFADTARERMNELYVAASKEQGQPPVRPKDWDKQAASGQPGAPLNYPAGGLATPGR